jgi:hypothetical protein
MLKVTDHGREAQGVVRFHGPVQAVIGPSDYIPGCRKTPLYTIFHRNGQHRLLVRHALVFWVKTAGAAKNSVNA